MKDGITNEQIGRMFRKMNLDNVDELLTAIKGIQDGLDALSDRVAVLEAQQTPGSTPSGDE